MLLLNGTGLDLVLVLLFELFESWVAVELSLAAAPAIFFWSELAD